MGKNKKDWTTGPTWQLTLADPGSTSPPNWLLEATRGALIRAGAGQVGTPTLGSTSAACPKYSRPTSNTHRRLGSSWKRQNTHFKSKSRTSHYFSQKAVVFKQRSLVGFIIADKENISWWWPLFVKVISSQALWKQTLIRIALSSLNSRKVFSSGVRWWFS